LKYLFFKQNSTTDLLPEEDALNRISLLSAALSLALLGCGRSAPPHRPPEEKPTAGPKGWKGVPAPARTGRLIVPAGNPDTGRGCATDLLTLDVLVHAPMPANYDATVAAAITEVEAGLQASWFEAPAGCAVKIERADIFEGLSITDKNRHQKVWFTCAGSPTAISIKTGNQCNVVSLLRSTLFARLGDTPDTDPDVRVARDCEGRAQGPLWHIEPAAIGGFPPLAATSAHQPVLAIVDTPPGPPGSPTHGDLVERVALDVLGPAAGRVEIERWVALPFDPNAGGSAGGFGSTSHIARTLGELAHKHAATGQPLVVNLSLGWPAEAGNEAILRQGACSVAEGAAGEAVRSALLKLQERSPSALVFAAAGNRAYQEAVVDIQAANTCANAIGSVHNSVGPNGLLPFSWDSAGSKHMFPALWSVLNTCNDRRPVDSRLLTIAVGMTGRMGILPPPPLSEGRTLYAPGAGILIDGQPAMGTSYATAVAAAAAARTSLDGVLAREDFLVQNTCIDTLRDSQSNAVLAERKRLRVGARQAPCPADPPPPPPEVSPNGCDGAPGCELAPVDAAAPASGSLEALRKPDQYALGLGAPAPTGGPCPFTVCRVKLNALVPPNTEHGVLDFSAKIDSQYEDSDGPTISDVKLVMFVGTVRHEISLTVTDWVGGNTYFFNDKAIGDTYTTSELQAATYFFECNVTEGTQTTFRSDAVQGP
jgi:hypothetical protein